MEKILEELKKYKNVVDFSYDAIILLDRLGRFVFVNDRTLQMTGYNKDELIGSHFKKIIPAEHLPTCINLFQRQLRGLNPTTFEIEIIGKKGNLVPIEINGLAVKDEGKIVGVQVIARDVTERKRMLEVVRESEAVFENVIYSLDDFIFLLDKNGKFIFGHAPITSNFFVPPEGFLRKKYSEVMPHHINKQIEIGLKKNKRGEPYGFEYWLKVDNKICWYSAKLTPMFSNSSYNGSVAVLRNITEQKTVELAIKESEEKYKTIFEGAIEGILIADTKTKKLIFANPAICKITGYSLKELLELNVNDIHPKKDLPHILEEFKKQVQKKKIITKNIPVLRKDKKLVYCDISSRPIKIGEQELLLGFFRVLTEQQ
jgi:PAS domain S-box-containing protein